MNTEITSSDYVHWLGEIKSRIRSSQQKAALAVNRELLDLYWFLGEALASKQTEWGDKFIDNLARDLKVEFPDMKGFSKRNLETIRRWYLFYASNFEITQQAVAQLQLDPKFSNAQQLVAQISDLSQQAVDLNIKALLYSIPWGSHIVILSKVNSHEEAFFYLVKTIQNNWSRANLTQHINTDLYNRQGKALTNFALTLPNPQADLAQEIIKNPYNFDFLTLAEDARELEVERALIKHLKKFMLELGKGFAYVGNQFNLNVDGDDFFLDLLFFNYNLNRFVIFELKVGDFKPEFAGKLNMYVNTVNEQVKLPHHEDTIGVLLCKTPNETVVKYSLKGINAPLGVSEYTFQTVLPDEIAAELPSSKEFEEEMASELEVLKDPLDEKRAKILELINNKAKEEVTKSKDKLTIEQLVQNILFPIQMKINELVNKNGILDWFMFNKQSYILDNNVFYSKKEVEAHLETLKTIHNITYEIELDGFKQAGTSTFLSRKRMKIDLSLFKYSISMDFNNNNNNVYEEFLYSHALSNDDITKIATEFVGDLMDQIHRDAERQLNTEGK